ncbi:MAG: hypothetical protein AAF533_22425 [Acidobacteriota bacterium]
MSLLEEAGEEDVCSLLNELMREQSDFGSGTDLQEYLAALVGLEKLGQLQAREYRIDEGRTQFGPVVACAALRGLGGHQFDRDDSLWKWGRPVRVMIEVVDA